jgi:endonuclease/exonuclease/phosphatase family metal-dependent hydrolase
MRPLIKRTVPDLPPPGEPLLAEARRSLASPVEHDRILKRVGALHALECRQSSQSREWPERLRVAAFNAERLKNRRAVRMMMDRVGAGVSMLSEVDVGMARSGNVHTIRDLIGSSGEGYLFGAEFVELDLGDAGEIRQHSGERNSSSLHGNAIVSGLELEDPHLIPLEESGLWFSGFEGAQRRIGGRIALAARVARAPRPLWVVGTHLESKTDPADRQMQIQNLLRALEALAPNAACIIGGDFNTKALPRGDDDSSLLLEKPESYEPLFADLRSAGFEWSQANLARPTQNAGPSNKHAPPFGKLDWVVVRGATAENPQVLSVLDEQGRAISDHEMLVVDIKL